jgi:hypothetical protein
MNPLRPTLAALALTSLSCVGSTGSDVVDFAVLAAGPANADPNGGRYDFDTSAGYHVALTKARLRIGAVYLNRSRPILGAQDTACILPGVYVAEATDGVDIDVLSSAPQPFPSRAHGTADRALAGEVWLTGGRIDALDDTTPIVEFVGEASRSGATYPFVGTITIGQNRSVSSSDPATPGANPICRMRIVSPIPVDLTPTSTGALVVRAEPRVWFDQVDFSKLEQPSGAGGPMEFPDETSGQPATTLFAGLRSVAAYSFEWRP